MSPSDLPALHVPARLIPIPATISPAAQRVLAFPPPAATAWPDDVDAQVAIIDQMTAMSSPGDQGAMVSGCYAAAPTDVPCQVERIEFDGVKVAVATPSGVTEADPRVLLELHGAWIFGGGHMADTGATMLAGNLGIRTWALDYSCGSCRRPSARNRRNRWKRRNRRLRAPRCKRRLTRRKTGQSSHAGKTHTGR